MSKQLQVFSETIADAVTLKHHHLNECERINAASAKDEKQFASKIQNFKKHLDSLEKQVSSSRFAKLNEYTKYSDSIVKALDKVA